MTTSFTINNKFIDSNSWIIIPKENIITDGTITRKSKNEIKFSDNLYGDGNSASSSVENIIDFLS